MHGKAAFQLAMLNEHCNVSLTTKIKFVACFYDFLIHTYYNYVHMDSNQTSQLIYAWLACATMSMNLLYFTNGYCYSAHIEF